VAAGTPGGGPRLERLPDRILSLVHNLTSTAGIVAIAAGVVAVVALIFCVVEDEAIRRALEADDRQQHSA
jgi:hypothetical protein